MIEITLPAGLWVITGGGVLNNNGAAADEGAYCDLNVDGIIAQAEDLFLGANGAVGERESITLTGATTVAGPTPAQFRCSLANGGNVLHPYISAIQVANLTTP